MDLSSLNRLIYRFEQNSKGPEQGTQEWLDIRNASKDVKRGRIGGSEMSSLIGVNPYKNRNALMCAKLGYVKDEFPSRLHCWFGITFEEVAAKVFEHIYDTKIFCKDISIIDSNLPYSIFSPDGICAMGIDEDTGEISIDPDIQTDKFAPVLVEIKCPLSRELTRNMNVPKHYMPQIQTGMHCIDLVHASVFIDNCFRMCSYRDLQTKKMYNRQLHRLDRQIKDDLEEIYSGCMFFHGIMPDDICTNYVQKHYLDDENYIYDFGGSSYTSVLFLLRKIRSGEYKIIYKNPSDLEINDTDKKAFGMIAWKLFESTCSLVYKDEVIVEKIIDCMTNYSEGKYDDVKVAKDEKNDPVNSEDED